MVDIRKSVIGFDDADLDGKAKRCRVGTGRGGVGGRRVLFQAVEATNRRVSDLVEHTFP